MSMLHNSLARKFGGVKIAPRCCLVKSGVGKNMRDGWWKWV